MGAAAFGDVHLAAGDGVTAGASAADDDGFDGRAVFDLGGARGAFDDAECGEAGV